MVSAGGYFAIALKTDGTLTAWGRNDHGQLGNGHAAQRSSPARVEGIDQVTAAAAGSGFTLALRTDGTLWGWGYNGSGELGDGTTQNKAHPVPVIGIGGTITSFAAGISHALAMTADGKLWAWGSGGDGELGTGDRGKRTSAVQVSGLPPVRAVAAGQGHSLALGSDGSVWAWGANAYGQLGNGTKTASVIPVRLAALSNIVAISAFGMTNLALDSAGQVWIWGYGAWAVSRNDGTTPEVVSGLPPIVAITAGNRFGIVVASDGSVWVWGNNDAGQLGDIGYTFQTSPVSAASLARLTDFSAGDSNVMARGPGDAIMSWGWSDYGQLGLGDTGDRVVPTVVSGLPQIAQFAAGLTHSVAVASDGTVWAWGSNGSGELADGIVAVANVPADVSGISNIVAVAAGGLHNLALDADGSVWGWGVNNNEALGDRSRRNALAPKKIAGLPAMTAVAAGLDTSFAIDTTGRVWSWGDNKTYGSLGRGSASGDELPGWIATLSGVTGISSTYDHALVVTNDGSVWSWGSNFKGALGDGTTTDRDTPVRVSGLSNIRSVAAGGFHSLALDAGGNVWAWGYNSEGQLGDGTTSARLAPVRVVGLSNAMAISAGENFSCALTADGRLWAWGTNEFGALGTGSSQSSVQLPAAISDVAGFLAVSCGYESAVALRTDGTVWAWGRNFEGQLGDATFAQHNTPALTVNATVNGPLDLNPQVANSIPTDKIPPFFTTAYRSGDLSKFSVSTTTKFNAADAGKSGAVFVTAMVPQSALGVPQAMRGQSAPNVAVAQPRSMALAAPASTFVLVQLTSSGWQPVVNGQLIPYASGVLGDQLAAQTILNGTDTTNLKGTEICLGYGTSAAEMNAVGRMRAIVTIPDPNATNASAQSCVLISDVRVFAYAEANYPSIFTGTATAGQATYQGSQYDYRYYPGSQNYLAVDDSRVIFLLGPFTGGVVTAVGPVESFRSVITTWEAAP